MTEEDLKFELCRLDKDNLVDLFVKMKDINEKLNKRLALVENQLDELIDIDTLINSIK